MRTLLAAALLVTGCSTIGPRTARPLPPGHGELTVTFIGSKDIDEDGRQDYVLPPAPEIGIRRGISDNVDVGGRVGFGVELDAKVRVLEQDGFHVAAVPILGILPDILGDDPLGRGSGGLGLLATFETGAGLAILSGVRGAAIFDLSGGGDVEHLEGGFVGFEWSGETYFMRPCVELLRSDSGDVQVAALALQLGMKGPAR
jgi:hypothetical protein